MTFCQTWLLGPDCSGAFTLYQEPWGSSYTPLTELVAALPLDHELLEVTDFILSLMPGTWLGTQ